MPGRVWEDIYLLLDVPFSVSRYVYTLTHSPVCVCMCLCIHIYTFTYTIYIHTYTLTLTHIHVYMQQLYPIVVLLQCSGRKNYISIERSILPHRLNLLPSPFPRRFHFFFFFLSSFANRVSMSFSCYAIPTFLNRHHCVR